MLIELTNSNSSVFQVDIPLYQGPLDLLIQLIEKEELDITKISLVQVTSSFLDYVKQLQDRKASEVSSFLVIAVKLMQIKSEALLPRPPDRLLSEDDLSNELLFQLIQYKKFKKISGLLKGRVAKGFHSYLRITPPLKTESKLDLSQVSVNDLTNAARRILAIPPAPNQNLNSVVTIQNITIKEKINLITNKLTANKSSKFSYLIKSNSRLEIIVTFLALLELIKQFRVQVKQENLFGDIVLKRYEDWGESNDYELEFGE